MDQLPRQTHRSDRVQSVSVVPVKLKILHDSFKKEDLFGASCQLFSRANCECFIGWGVIRAFVGEAAAVRTCVYICVASSGASKGNFFRGKGMGGTAERCVHVCSLCILKCVCVCTCVIGLLLFKSSGVTAAEVSL